MYESRHSLYAASLNSTYFHPSAAKQIATIPLLKYLALTCSVGMVGFTSSGNQMERQRRKTIRRWIGRYSKFIITIVRLWFLGHQLAPWCHNFIKELKHKGNFATSESRQIVAVLQLRVRRHEQQVKQHFHRGHHVNRSLWGTTTRTMPSHGSTIRTASPTWSTITFGPVAITKVHKRPLETDRQTADGRWRRKSSVDDAEWLLFCYKTIKISSLQGKPSGQHVQIISQQQKTLQCC